MHLLTLNDIPFLIGHLPSPENPHGLPNLLPLRLALDEDTGRVFQEYDSEIAGHLAQAYAHGSLLGTAMDDTEMGRPYAIDFLEFLKNKFESLQSSKVLEIGAGRGYFVKLLSAEGADAIGIEPGISNAPHWKRHNVRVICCSFPSSKLSATFDLIVSFALLEHIVNPVEFLRSLKSQLTSGGKIAMAVPNVGLAIANGDLAMFIHEHYSFFSKSSLERTLAAAGFRCLAVEPAKYGGALYLLAEVSSDGAQDSSQDTSHGSATAEAREFPAKVQKNIAFFRRRLQGALERGRSVGIYCAACALPLLPSDAKVRLFDDDPDLHKRFYPALRASIENRADLLRDPVDEIWIMSRSFGVRLKQSLSEASQLKHSSIFLMNELFAT
jgi:2-polyprenyl-3-methyl-5-hydroxy-6-metoxy-1,4-benzoquinol methylase